MRHQPNNASDNQQHYDHTGERDGGQIHNVLIGFAPTRWVLSHLDSELNAKWPAP
jgi:hypothetical protein